MKRNRSHKKGGKRAPRDGVALPESVGAYKSWCVTSTKPVSVIRKSKKPYADMTPEEKIAFCPPKEQSISSTPPRAESPVPQPALQSLRSGINSISPGAESSVPQTALQKLRSGINPISPGVITVASKQVKPRWFGVQPAHGIGRTRKRRGTRRSKTHRRRR